MHEEPQTKFIYPPSGLNGSRHIGIQPPRNDRRLGDCQQGNNPQLLLPATFLIFLRTQCSGQPAGTLLFTIALGILVIFIDLPAPVQLGIANQSRNQVRSFSPKNSPWKCLFPLTTQLTCQYRSVLLLRLPIHDFHQSLLDQNRPASVREQSKERGNKENKA